MNKREIKRLIDHFQIAIKASHISDLELAWSIRIDPEHLKELLNKKRLPNEKQTKEIQRFIVRSKRRPFRNEP